VPISVIRLVVAAAIIAAIVGQLQLSIGYWQAKGGVDVAAHVAHFFSFFTIESNILAAAVMLVGLWLLFVKKGEDPRWFTLLRASSTTYMAVTGIVYNLLLRGIELPQGSTLPWSNEVLHVVACVWLVVDWIFAPGRSPIAANQLLKVLVFPIVWVLYTLIRGPIATDSVYGADFWYPYPFLNPNIAPEGYFTVAFYVMLIAVAIGSVGAGVLWISRRKSVTA